jgi:hypothetical protein
LESFVELKDEYPHTKFYAWHVSLEGEASEYDRTNETVDEAEGTPSGVPHATHKLIKHIISQVGHEGAHAIVKSLNWGDGASKELLHLIVNDLKQNIKKNSSSSDKPAVAENAALPGDFKLMGQDLFLKNLARNLKQRYPDATVKLLNDRVTAYHNKQDDEALSVMGTEVMDSGYIGVGLDDAFTESFQGVLVPTIKQTTEQLLAANPGTRPALFLSTDNWNPDAWTHIASKLGYRLVADDESLDENFADGRNPGRKGLAKRSGVNTKASVTSLRNTAKHSSGEKARMAHWLANMKAGRAKHK